MPTVIEQQDRAINGSVEFDISECDGESINEKALLIENMELVEPKKMIHVPNHLLETKTFAKVGQNALVHTKPAVVHFEGFEVGQLQKKRLVILNASSDVLRMHIVPPQTKHFYIKYTKPERMVAGTTLDCTIEFTPDEWRYYYDCIRIHCPGEENLLVPIHGYPIMNTKEFPRNYTFQSIPVGHRISRSFPLKCMAPIDFEFNIKYLQPHPAFLVEPLSGIVPADGFTEITITFAPFEFQTATMRLELSVSQFNSKGIVCTFIGNSHPGLLKTKTMSTVDQDVLDPRCFSPLDRARRNQQKSSRRVKIAAADKQNRPSESMSLERGGIRFHADLNNPHAVNTVMMQEPGKLKVNEMRETMLAKNASKASTRQMKEAVFDHSVRQNVYEERQNQLRWQVKVGDDIIPPKRRYEILEERNEAIKLYMYTKRGDPIPEDEYTRPKTSLKYKRTFRDVESLGSRDALFDTYSNDLWASRHANLDRFVQAARTIIIRDRAQIRLNCLQNYALECKRKKNASSVGGDSRDKNIEFPSSDASPEANMYLFNARKVQGHKFPTYVQPNVKDDMAPDALGDVPFKPTLVFVKRDVPYFNLKVPLTYKLQNYKKHNTQEASSGYVSTTRVRALRAGAEDEIIKLPSDDAAIMNSSHAAGHTDLDDAPLTTRMPRRASTGADATEAARDMIPVVSHHQPVSLTPPASLFKSIDYPSLHIVNPAPGLQVFQAPMPYAEVDYDFHLCPLPRYPRTDPSGRQPPTQKKFLDREDTIRGMMSWKKFPSQGLTSLSNTPTLTNVWVPRWDDCFSSDLLPEDVPPLFDRLASDDADNVVEDNDDDADIAEDGTMHLKPEMISAQFTLITPSTPSEDQKVPADLFPYGNRMPNTNIPVGAHGPVAREKREEELEYFMTKKYNRLGSKVKTKITSLNGLVSDPDIILK